MQHSCYAPKVKQPTKQRKASVETVSWITIPRLTAFTIVLFVITIINFGI